MITTQYAGNPCCRTRLPPMDHFEKEEQRERKKERGKKRKKGNRVTEVDEEEERQAIFLSRTRLIYPWIIACPLGKTGWLGCSFFIGTFNFPFSFLFFFLFLFIFIPASFFLFCPPSEKDSSLILPPVEEAETLWGVALSPTLDNWIEDKDLLCDFIWGSALGIYTTPVRCYRETCACECCRGNFSRFYFWAGSRLKVAKISL